MTALLPRLEDLMAWATGYDLIAALALTGPRGERRDDLMRIPELVPLLGGVPEDELLADHFDLFGRAVPPFANAFLDEQGLAGGDQAAALARLYRGIGYTPPTDAPGEDHLGVILQALAHAVLTEIEMARHGDDAGARRAQAVQIQLLDAHLLTWVWPLTYAVAGEPYPLYTKVTGAMLEVLAAHRASLDSSGGAAAAAGGSEPPRDFDAKAVAGWLATPRRSGIFLTRRDIESSVAREDLPKSFGESRTSLLAEALRSADRFGRLAPLLESFAASIAGAVTFYESLPAALSSTTTPWVERSRASAAHLAHLARLATGAPSRG